MIKIGKNISEFSVHSCQPKTKKELKEIINKWWKEHKGYEELAYYIMNRFDSESLPLTTEAQKDFINSFNSLLNIMNILSVFERFENERIIDDYKFQGYMSIYNDLRDKFRKPKEPVKVDVTDDIEFETELVKQFEINIDYTITYFGVVIEKNSDKVFILDYQY